ncbi:MAG: radical SAM protein [Oscillospiraceae bacterium]|nr:radical SAM protein [Oscillospiraceae bacterium]
MDMEIRKTRSACPVCLRNLPARLVRSEDGAIRLEKSCPEHGNFRVPVWRGRLDFGRWILGAEELTGKAGLYCPENCGLCGEHESETCCILLEVTKRCNLRCRFCFADGGAPGTDPTAEECREAIRDIVRQCGKPLIQFSGGEPTMRDDLPDLVRFAREAGCSYTQVNTNGIRIARDPEYAEKLAEAGLDIVFLQFDGTREDIYEKLRGRPLLETKLQAVRTCAELRLGVTLVPTVVPGVNDGDLGNIISLAREMVPGVRGVHFQPVSYFGRYPDEPQEDGRYTLDQLMADICEQTGIPAEVFLPSRCDHPLCGFHAGFLIDADGGLQPLSPVTRTSRNRGSAAENREYIAGRWRRAPEGPAPVRELSDGMDFDTFLRLVRHRSLTLSAMAFQDAGNLNMERLRRCSLHVYDRGRIVPFCAKYLTAVR